MNRALYEQIRDEAAADLRARLGLRRDETIQTGIVLGTGWADAFPLDVETSADMSEMEAFKGLDFMEGHKRRFELGTVPVEGRIPERVLVLRGRIHMNEDTLDLSVRWKVRLQIEVMIALGVKRLILTAAAGALHEGIKTRSVLLVDGFVGWGQDVMPNLGAAEFVNPGAALNQDVLGFMKSKDFPTGPHVFFRGPHFEDAVHDKPRIAQAGGAVVGMSLKPECFVVAIYRELMGHDDLSVVALAYVSNDPTEEMDDEEHRRRAKEDATMLSNQLLAVMAVWNAVG